MRYKYFLKLDLLVAISKDDKFGHKLRSAELGFMWQTFSITVLSLGCVAGGKIRQVSRDSRYHSSFI